MSRRGFLNRTRLGLLLLALPGLHSPAAMAQASVKIGIIAPFNTPPGEGLLNAARMAADDINAAGGIGGKPVELVLANDEYKPDAAVNAYKKLALSDRVAAVIGTASSGVALAVVDQMARYRVPFISTGAATLQLSEKVEKEYEKYKYWFRVMHTTEEMAGALGDFAVGFFKKEKGQDRAAILAENAVWAKGLLPSVKKTLAAGGVNLVAEESFDVDTKDFKPLLTKIARSNPHYIIDLSSHVDGAIYVKQWGELQGAPMFGVNASGASSRFWKDTDRNAISHMDLIVGSYRVALTPKTIDWYDRYLARWKVSPDYTSGYTYDALHIVKAAIEKGGGAPEKLVAALESTDHVGVAARWSFEKNHNGRFGPGYRTIGITQWQAEGERAVIWPPEIRTGRYIEPPWSRR